MIDPELDLTYAAAALNAGRLVLYWAGLENLSGHALADPDTAERFLDALGNSSVPEAVHTVAASVTEDTPVMSRAPEGPTLGELLSALRAVIDYDWQAEQRDYEEQQSLGESGDGHVFAHLVTLDRFVGAVSS